MGAWFTGGNETAARTWKTRSQVTVADRGREFAFVVGGSWVHWWYSCAAAAEGTVMTESWEVVPGGMARFHERYGENARAELDERSRAAREGIPITLAAIERRQKRPSKDHTE